MVEKMKTSFVILLFFGLCAIKAQNDLILDYETAVKLSGLPQECYNKEFPHKFGPSFETRESLKPPKDLHPIFYGCFDWHSSVHGHWLLASMLSRFPGTPLAENVTKIFQEQFKPEKVVVELEVFDHDPTFERTYGWAWFLKLHDELLKNPSSDAKVWAEILQPLSDRIVQGYLDYLPKLIYPIRVGEHTNTPFGLIFALEYAKDHLKEDLEQLIVYNATGLYSNDSNCPLDWEPSGHDFLSPCLQEADLMFRIQDLDWLESFLPGLFEEDFDLEPGTVIDRTDGKLVHLDGLNFSRAWNLYSLVIQLQGSSQTLKDRLLSLADEHVRTSFDFVVGSDYAGSHWLASFLTYALQTRERAIGNM